jgi:hypothetical protein
MRAEADMHQTLTAGPNTALVHRSAQSIIIERKGPKI